MEEEESTKLEVFCQKIASMMQYCARKYKRV